MRTLMQLTGQEVSLWFILWYLICLLFCWVITYSVILGQRRFAQLSALSCGGTITLLLCIKHLYGARLPGILDRILGFVARMPYVLAVLLSAALLVEALVMIFLCSRYRRTHVSAISIKDFTDAHPAAVALWKESGKVLLSNRAANDLSVSVTGTPLLNGEVLLNDLAPSPVTLPDGRIWDYRHNTFQENGETCHQLTAVDVTLLHEKNQMLEQENAQLEKLNRELKEYNSKIELLVRGQEILGAKIRIHDEMNRMLAATSRTFAEDDPERQKELLQYWKNYTSLLTTEKTTREDGNIRKDLHTFGELMGINLVCEKLPSFENQQCMRLMVRAIRESMVNARKHAEAQNLYLKTEEEMGQIQLIFTNDGKKPSGNKAGKPAGGLASLAREAQGLGGTLQMQTEPFYELRIVLPMGTEQLRK